MPWPLIAQAGLGFLGGLFGGDEQNQGYWESMPGMNPYIQNIWGATAGSQVPSAGAKWSKNFLKDYRKDPGKILNNNPFKGYHAMQQQEAVRDAQMSTAMDNQPALTQRLASLSKQRTQQGQGAQLEAWLNNMTMGAAQLNEQAKARRDQQNIAGNIAAANVFQQGTPFIQPGGQQGNSWMDALFGAYQGYKG